MRPGLTTGGLNAALDAYEQWVDTQIHVPFEERKKACFVDGMVSHCQKGCSKCCELLVTVGAPDALRLARHLKKNGMDTKELRASLRADVEFVQMLAKENKCSEDNVLANHYVAAKRPCVFIKDGACSVYEARPVVCRLFNSLVPAEECMGDKRDGVKRIKTDDIKDVAAKRCEEFSRQAWAPLAGLLSEMTLWALEQLDVVEKRNA